MVFQRVAIDPARLTIEGFSDGATYALGVGLTNGDLFQRVIAFSPASSFPSTRTRARMCSSRTARATRSCPIDQCSRRIVPQLERARYDVQYREFDGPHAVPPDIARNAVDWMGLYRLGVTGNLRN